MSDNIPFDIQLEIFKRLPVKSLLQLRSVSKSWKSLINSSEFNAHYVGHHPRLERLFVRSLIDFSDSGPNNRSRGSLFSSSRKKYVIKDKYVSVVFDDTFSQQKAAYLKKPLLVQVLERSIIIGSSHGLVCFFGECEKGHGSISRARMVVLWNISTRKTVGIVFPNVSKDARDETVLGFWVCRKTSDPKIVKISQVSRWSRTCIPWQVEVFTLSTGAWRSPGSNLPRESIHLGRFHEVVEGFIYWLAGDRITIDGEYKFSNLIISFDMTSEEFREVTLPESLTHQYVGYQSIFKLGESLVVLENGASVFSVWMMEDGVLHSFTKLFSFNVNKPDSSIWVLGFRNSVEPIMEISGDDSDRGQVVVYEPNTKHIDNLLGMNGKEWSFCVYHYMETLLLNDKPDLTVYNGRGTFKFEDEDFAYN
ncbi:putative F-box protein At1g32420 [Bidens hawaiensis]|uniref:putative F-box protein At1g32420 n=1 Tax=Bidens hawaiensis TaxID=980011 RepID=UPI004048F8E2